MKPFSFRRLFMFLIAACSWDSQQAVCALARLLPTSPPMSEHAKASLFGAAIARDQLTFWSCGPKLASQFRTKAMGANAEIHEVLKPLPQRSPTGIFNSGPYLHLNKRQHPFKSDPSARNGECRSATRVHTRDQSFGQIHKEALANSERQT